MKRTQYLKPLAALGALGLFLATAHGQASISHSTTTAMSNSGNDGANGPFGISVKPGNAKYVQSVAAGGASGPLGDGTLLDWQIHTAVGGESPFAGNTVSSGPGTYFDTATCADSSVGGPQNYFDVWEANDIDTEAADIPNGTTPAVGNGPTPIKGNIDISGLTAGQIYVINGTYRASVRVNLTMTGPGMPPIVMPEHVAPYDASTNRSFLMEFTFANPNGEYTNIEWSSNNGQNNTGRRRWGGIFLDGTIFVDTVEPEWVATWPNAGPVGSTLFTLNGNTNEDSTAYFVVLADGASAPTSAQVKAGTDASGAPAPFSGSFALDALVEGSETVTGLTTSTAYDVYMVAEDVRGPNLQTTPVLIDVTTTPPDTTPPGWTATYPQVSRAPAGLTGIANLDEAGAAYFVVLSSGASAPTSVQVKAGTDASDAAAPSGSMPALTAGDDGSAIVGGLTVGATYDVWFVAEDLEGNLQAAPQMVSSAPVAAVDQFVTGAFTWGTSSVWSANTLGPYTNPWGDGNNAVFEGVNGLVSVASGTVVKDITFNSNNWLLQGGPLTLAGTTQPVINVNGNTPRLENSLSGNQGFTKTGTGTLRMVGSNSITGGFVIDGGQLGDDSGAPGTAALNNNDITANAGAVGLTLASGTTTDGGIAINDTTLRISNNNGSITVNGAVTGTGGIELNKTGDGQNLVSLLGTANTFTGGVNYTGNRNLELNVNSFADSAAPGEGNIRFGLGTPSDINRRNRFALQSGAIVPVTLTNRQFEIASSGSEYPAQIYNNSGQAFTINSDLIVSATGVKRLELGGTGAGVSTFAGDIVDGSATLALFKTGSGTWVLSGDNTFTGTTTVTAGTLALVGGSQDSAITVNNGASLGFTLGSPTTSTQGVTLNAGHKIAVSGTPDGTSDYLLMTAASFSGTPVLDPSVGGYSLEVQGSGTQLVLVAPAPSATLVIDLGTGTVIEGGAFGTFGATNLPLPPLPVGSILRSVSVDAAITATDNENFASDLAILFDPTPGTPGGDFSLRMTSGTITFGATNQLTWSGGASGPPTTLVETKNAAEWAAVGPIDLATYGIFLGNAYQDTGWVAPEGGTWSGTITLTYDIVSPGGPYDTWAAVNAPSGNPDDDFDGDGVANAVEFVLGGLASTNDLGLLPAAATSGGNMTFTFVRDQDSVDASVSTVIEVGTTLSTWPDVYTVGANTGSSTAGVTVTDNANGTDTITLTVTRAPDTKKFARLKVNITP